MSTYQSTLLSIRTNVIEKLRLDEDADTALVDEWINLAYIDVAQRSGFVQTFETIVAPDTTGFDIPTDTGWITELFVDGELAQHVTLEEIVRQRASGSTATGPLYARVGGTRIEVYPDPSAATLDVWQSDLVQELTADGDEPVFPEPFGSKLLEAGALVEGAKFKKDPLLQLYEQSFQSWFEQFETWTAKRTPQKPMRLRLRLPLATFGGLQSSVADHLNLDTEDQERVKGWLNRAYFAAVQQTGCLQTLGAAVLTSGTSSYTLPTPIAWIKHVVISYTDGSVSAPLQRIRLERLLMMRQGSTSAGQRIIVPFYAIAGLNQIELWPEPGSGETLQFWYSYLPDELVDDDDVPVIQEPFGSKLLEYGALVEGARFKKDPLIQDYEFEYDRWLIKFQAWVNRRQGASSQVVEVWDRPLTNYNDLMWER